MLFGLHSATHKKTTAAVQQYRPFLSSIPTKNQ